MLHIILQIQLLQYRERNFEVVIIWIKVETITSGVKQRSEHARAASHMASPPPPSAYLILLEREASLLIRKDKLRS